MYLCDISRLILQFSGMFYLCEDTILQRTNRFATYWINLELLRFLDIKPEIYLQVALKLSLM